MKRLLGLTQREGKSEDSGIARIERSQRLAGPEQRSEVLQIAATQFAKTGLRGTTTLMLARAAGISERALYVHFGSKEGLFRKAVEDNIGTRLQLLEGRTASGIFESETAAIQHIAEATVTVCVAGAGNSILTNWALLEDPEYAAELYRNEMGAVELVWDRALAERFPDSRSRRILSVHLVPYAVSACLAYGLWLATLRQDADSAAALAEGFAEGIAQAASALLSEESYSPTSSPLVNRS
jgi:AcrR family transcriptional regulator